MQLVAQKGGVQAAKQLVSKEGEHMALKYCGTQKFRFISRALVIKDEYGSYFLTMIWIFVESNLENSVIQFEYCEVRYDGRTSNSYYWGNAKNRITREMLQYNNNYNEAFPV